MFYFVAYELSINGVRQPISNVILKDAHPVEWAAIKPAAMIETRILFWQEIPENIALAESVRKTFSVEEAST